MFFYSQDNLPYPPPKEVGTEKWCDAYVMCWSFCISKCFMFTSPRGHGKSEAVYLSIAWICPWSNCFSAVNAKMKRGVTTAMLGDVKLWLGSVGIASEGVGIPWLALWWVELARKRMKTLGWLIQNQCALTAVHHAPQCSTMFHDVEYTPPVGPNSSPCGPTIAILPFLRHPHFQDSP